MPQRDKGTVIAQVFLISVAVIIVGQNIYDRTPSGQRAKQVAEATAKEKQRVDAAEEETRSTAAKSAVLKQEREQEALEAKRKAAASRPPVYHGPSEETRAYVEKVRDICKNAHEAMVLYQQFNNEAEQSPTLILDDTWKVKQAVAIAAIREEMKRIRGISNVPSDCRQIHRNMLKMADEANRATYSYASGIDHLRASDFVKSGRQFSSATHYGKNVADGISALAKRYPELDN